MTSLRIKEIIGCIVFGFAVAFIGMMSALSPIPLLHLGIIVVLVVLQISYRLSICDCLEARDKLIIASQRYIESLEGRNAFLMEMNNLIAKHHQNVETEVKPLDPTND